MKSRLAQLAVSAIFPMLLASGAMAQSGSQSAKPKAPKDDPDAIGTRDVCGGINFYGLNTEMAMGKQMAQIVARDAKVMDDPIVSEYVNRLVQNLVRSSDVKIPVSIQVVDGEEINAYTLPGGYLFVNTGLILAADSEAQLAGALAHEVAHVACRHATRQATNGDLTRIGATLASIAIGGWPGYAIGQGASVAIPVQYLKFSQRYESDADFYGLQYLYKAGYDPTELVSFFERIESMEKNKPGTLAKFFSTHPMTDDRIKKSQKEIDKDLAGRPEYVLTTSEFEAVKARLEMLHNRRKTDPVDPGRPTLKRGPGGNSPVDPGDDTKKKDDSERPTLQRRDGGGGGN
jgi:predicted Zn-dependent protease